MRLTDAESEKSPSYAKKRKFSVTPFQKFTAALEAVEESVSQRSTV